MNEAGHQLFRELEEAKKIREQILEMLQGDGEADEEVLADTLEGETNLEAEIERAVALIQSDLALIEGAKLRIEAMTTRKKRFEARIERTRALIEAAQQVSGRKKIELAIATLSLSAAAPALVIDDELAIPSRYFEAQPAKLDKAGLGKDMRRRAKALGAVDDLVQQQKISEEEARARVAAIDAETPAVPGAHLEPQGKSLTLTWK